MKTILIGALTLSLLGGAAANAQAYGDHNNNRHEARVDRDHHPSWRQGQRLPPQYRVPARYVDYHRHHLRAPPRGYRWVQVDNGRYAMVAITSGLIASIVAAR